VARGTVVEVVEGASVVVVVEVVEGVSVAVSLLLQAVATSMTAVAARKILLVYMAGKLVPQSLK
jgi:hypothetical protein